MIVKERPYILDDLPPFEMWNWSPELISTSLLIPTQPMLVIDRLNHVVARGNSKGNDPYPHIVKYENKFYIHDGHHRWAYAWLSNQNCMMVKIYKVL